MVERSTNGYAFAPIVYLPGNANSYADSTAIGGSSYYYRIAINNGEYVSGYSNYVGPVASPLMEPTLAWPYATTSSPGVTQNGRGITNCNAGYWVEYTNVYFLAGVNQVALNYTTPNGSGDYIQVRVDSLSNPAVAQDTTQTYSSSPGTDTVSVSSVTAGMHTVYISFVQHGTGPSTEVCNLNWFQFSDSLAVAAHH